MNRIKAPAFLLPLFLLSVFSSVFAQLSAPRPEAVYGGRIRAMTAIPLGADSTRLFVSTESANSVFVSDIYAPAGSSASIDPFSVLPTLNDVAGFGGNIEKMGSHATSRTLWFLHQNYLYRTHITATSNQQIAGPGVQAFVIQGDHLIYLEGNQLHFGVLDASGAFTKAAASPIAGPTIMGPQQIAVHPISGEIFVFGAGMSPQLYHLGEAFDAISGTVSFVDVSPPGLPTSIPWSVLGLAPDGKIYIAGSDVMSKQIASTVHQDSAWSHYDTGMFGAAGGNLSFSGDSTNYWMYFGSAYNDLQGQAGYWHHLGNMGFETHPNDGYVLVDPTNPDLIYLTTDQGIGASENQGQQIFEINEGIEAVQVKDFDMTGDKETAWLASKSGIRKVSTYLSTPSWTPAMFPNGDGSPYFAVAMNPADTNDVYVGNIRVYHTPDGGATWTQQFNATQAPYHFPAFATPTQGASRITCLEICPLDPQIVFAGYSIEREEEGGLFWSGDGGNSWDQVLLHAGSIGFDVDVEDVVFNLEGSDTVAYVGVAYDVTSPAGRSVYRLVKNGMNWIVNQDMDATGTSTGTLIVATIRDVSVSWTGDTLFACGTDAGANHPIAYYKPLNSTGLWTPFPTSGFPFISGKQGYSVTLGHDTVYVAVDNEVYFHEVGSSNWMLGYTYPVGTEINFLYFDELLVGTSTGLYGHVGTGEMSTSLTWKDKRESLDIFPNPAREAVIVSLGEAAASPRMITIFQLNGQIVFRQESRQAEIVISLENWQSGLYLIQVQGKEGMQSGKLLVR